MRCFPPTPPLTPTPGRPLNPRARHRSGGRRQRRAARDRSFRHLPRPHLRARQPPCSARRLILSRSRHGAARHAPCATAPCARDRPVCQPRMPAHCDCARHPSSLAPSLTPLRPSRQRHTHKHTHTRKRFAGGGGRRLEPPAARDVCVRRRRPPAVHMGLPRRQPRQGARGRRERARRRGEIARWASTGHPLGF